MPEPEPEPAPAREPAARIQAFDPNIRRMRPARSRPAQTAAQKLQFQLWLGVGGFCVLLVLYTAFQGFQKNNNAQPQIEGANEEMQHAATMARNELAKDSTNVSARIMLANILYDSANWSEAVIHYKSALSRDSTRVTTLVDLGVCYFNLGRSDEAIEMFQRALRHEPNHPIALFNMGVVSESRNEFSEAIRYYDRAKAANPPTGMAQGIEEAKQRVLQKQAGGAAGGGMPGR
ncbi:MAG: tetratricopeptide repeat protein [Candidatus Eisenbacteria bacterium]